MISDYRTEQVLSGFPSNIKAPYDPADPLHILIRAAYASGLYSFNYVANREFNNIFPHTVSTEQVRRIYAITGTKDWVNPSVTTTVTYTKAEDEEEFLYGPPTHAAIVTAPYSVTELGTDVITGLAYIRNNSAEDGQLYCLCHDTNDDFGRLGKVDLTCFAGTTTFGTLGDFADWQYKTQSYATTGVDTFLTLQIEDDTVDMHPHGYPVTTQVAQLPHIFIRTDAGDRTKRIYVYDVLNLDANGNALLVDEAEYTIDLTNGIITFLTFFTGPVAGPRPSYTAGEQPDPGWNSTYIVEYQYRVYESAYGLSPFSYLQDFGTIRNSALLAGMTPNLPRLKLVANLERTPYVDNASRTFLQAPRSSVIEGTPVTVSFSYTARETFTWMGTGHTVGDYLAATEADLPTNLQSRLEYHEGAFGYQVIATIDGSDQELDATQYTFIGQGWGVAYGTFTIVDPAVPYGTPIKIYYRSLYAYTTTTESAYEVAVVDKTNYELVIDKDGRKVAHFNVLIHIDDSGFSAAQLDIIGTLPTANFVVTIDTSPRKGVAVDPMRHLIWTIEDNAINIYNEFGEKIDQVSPPNADPNWTGTGQYIMDTDIAYPVVPPRVWNNNTTTMIIYWGLVIWRNWLLVLYELIGSRSSPDDLYLGVLDPSNPYEGFKNICRVDAMPGSAANGLTVGPDNQLFFACGSDIWSIQMYFYRYLLNNNEVLVRYSDTFIVTEATQSVGSNTLPAPAVNAVPRDIVTSIDNILSLVTMNRMPGMANTEDAKRAVYRMERATDSTRYGILHALYSEFAIESTNRLQTRRLYTLSRQPLTTDPTGTYYPVSVLVEGVPRGTPAWSCGDTNIQCDKSGVTGFDGVELSDSYSGSATARIWVKMFTGGPTGFRIQTSINGRMWSSYIPIYFGQDITVANITFRFKAGTYTADDIWAFRAAPIPTGTIRLYNNLGNKRTTGWDWTLWTDPAGMYTKFLEFRSLPPHRAYTPLEFQVKYWTTGPDGLPLEFTDTFYPEATKATDQPVEIGIFDIHTTAPVFSLHALNDTMAMRSLGYLDAQNRPTAQLLALIQKQDDITRLRWKNGAWDFTPWSNETQQNSGLEYVPALFDAEYITINPASRFKPLVPAIKAKTSVII